jgi:hypothetical protein
VNFYRGATLLGTETLVNGVATLTTATITVGAHSIVAKYSASSTDAASESKVLTQVVNALTPSTTTLTSTPNPSTVGQTVMFTATVTPASGPAPAGTVNFYHLTTLLGSATVSGGVATFTTSALPLGTSHIHAVYVGSSEDARSTSAVIAQVVNAPTHTTTALTSSPNPSTVGQAVTFKATVTAVSAPVPTGTVSFYRGATLLGTETLVNGVATLTTSTITAGSHSIAAHYSGSATDAVSESAVFTQVVNH